ncbi:hypothetical protein [Methanoregula sp.]
MTGSIRDWPAGSFVTVCDPVLRRNFPEGTTQVLTECDTIKSA